MLMQTHRAKTRAEMDTIRSSNGDVGPLRLAFRSFVRLVAAMTMIFTLQVALAQAANDCNDVVTAATTAAKAEKDALDEREKLTNQAVENAKACIDRLLQVIRNMSPTWPSVQSISIQMIVDYLSNKICSVAVAQVNSTLGPISSSVNGGINSAVGSINGVAGGVSGGVIGSGGVGPIVSSGGGGKIISESTTSTGTSSSSKSSSSSIWSKMGCVFGSGSDCN